MNHIYLRGEIYYADLDPVVGSEQMGTRPVLILQNNVGNHFARTVIVAPITSRIHTKSKIPTHSYIGMIGSKSKREQVYAFLRAQGVPDAELAAVRCPIGLSIGAETPRQIAVSVVAELLAARAGTLQRLRFED